MDLTRKTHLLLVAASLLLGISLSAYQIEISWAQSRKETMDNLNQAEAKLVALRRNITLYENFKSGVVGDKALTKHEKVSVTSSFTAAELPKIPHFLTQAYEKDGFLLLKSFSLAWSDVSDAQTKSGESAKLELNLVGEKVFMH